ncbi:histone-like nucleoid-structuring protein Lsr2 [Arsenicicoccus dermatophilus]|uniref:histone-like nucleoid-structuring protein Lsr2 n=1 Tax=Arsenicicoccus dermatophilus TaxID=1076331 RepID=UPI001F4CED93|nr:Lsr2 family protein [Arsenicicoccus dermatophilus]MCH8614389.1 Lsr2 family protein [Arsenicicoccus dermatophilus]
MAQRVQVILEDDITGDPADETVRFALDGVEYEIDLTTEHATKLREDLSSWIGHGRRTTTRKTSTRGASRGTTSSADRRRNGEMRAWLREQGHQISQVGRISRELQDLYDAAH